MKEVELVVKISEEIYKRILPYRDFPLIGNLANDFSELIHAVANGVPIPTGHGRLIDASKIDCRNGAWTFAEAIEYAPTIIEADRSEEE